MSEGTPSLSKQQFRAHAIHDTLRQWEEKLRDEQPANLKEAAAEVREAYLRLRWVLRDVRHRLGKTDPFLSQTSVLNAINSHVGQIQGPWEQFCGNPNEQWQPLESHTDGLLNHMRNLPSSGGTGAWREVFDEVRAEMDAAIAEAKDTIQGLQQTADGTEQQFAEANKKLEELVSEIQAQKPRLDQMLTQQSEAFTKTEQDRAAQFAQSEQDRLARFNETQDTRKNEFDVAVSEWDEKAKAVIAANKARLDEVTTSANEQSDDLLQRVQDQLDKAVEIVGTIVKTTMSGNYQIIANREYWNAWIMRGIAIAAFLGMGGMIVWAASSIDFGENGANWTTVGFRISLGLAFLIPGLYCAKESGRHWDAEKHNRRIALELAALDPFLVKLDDAKQKEIIEKKADEYFGQGSVRDEDEAGKTLKEISVRGDQLLKIVEHVAAALRGK